MSVSPLARAIHHVQITIPKGKEEEARRFYCGVLGLKETEKPVSLQGRGGFWAEAANLTVHIGTEDGVDRMATKAHVAYVVEDAMAAAELLRGHGIEILESVPIPGYARFEFRDPFGNRAECIQPLELPR